MSLQLRMPVCLMTACLGLVTSVQGLAASAGDSTAVAGATAASSVNKEPSLPIGGGSEFRARMLSWTPPARSPELRAKTVIGASAAAPLVISSPFGWRSDPIKGIRRRHSGIDLPGRSGTRIYATGAGIVSFAGWMKGYGNLVQIDHPGAVRTRYGHLSRILVSGGVPVAQGDLIGQMGSTGRSTGNHLHYEVRAAGVPVNPLAYIGQTAPSTYETVWAPETPVTARWTGWQSAQSAISLPEAKIR
jgi:murein DD-endopeptidase MepM/ murein hydrolase activator NlpD